MPVAPMSLAAIIAAEAAATVVVEIHMYDSRHVRQIDFESLSASRTAASAEFTANCVSASAKRRPTLRPVNSPDAASVMWPKRARPTNAAVTSATAAKLQSRCDQRRPQAEKRHAAEPAAPVSAMNLAFASGAPAPACAA